MMPKGKLSPEGEVIAAYGAATVAAFQVLINCLEESDAILPGQFPEALRVYMEMVKSRRGEVSDMTLAVLHDIRMATLDQSRASRILRVRLIKSSNSALLRVMRS
jgi:hypothetical protein